MELIPLLISTQKPSTIIRQEAQKEKTCMSTPLSLAFIPDPPSLTRIMSQQSITISDNRRFTLFSHQDLKTPQNAPALKYIKEYLTAPPKNTNIANINLNKVADLAQKHKHLRSLVLQELQEVFGDGSHYKTLKDQAQKNINALTLLCKSPFFSELLMPEIQNYIAPSSLLWPIHKH